MISMEVEYFGDKPYEYTDDSGIVQRGVIPHYLDRESFKLERIPAGVELPDNLKQGDKLVLSGMTYTAKAVGRSGRNYDATCIMWQDCRRADSSLKAAV